METWRSNALEVIADAKAEIEASTEPTIVAILIIGEADLLKERPLSFYSNQTRKWLQRVLAFAAWRLSLESEEAEASPDKK